MLAATGCSQLIYKPAGWVASDFAQRHLIPDMMNSDRLDSGCALSLAGQPVFSSLDQIADMPADISIMLDLSNGFCLQQQAWEKQLEVIRYQKSGQLSQARDSRIAAQRLWQVAAKRLQNAWVLFEQDQLANRPAGQCDLSEQQQLSWIMGISAGMQAVYSDTQAASGMNVSREIVIKAWKNLPCLDNQRWWGIPNAMQASIEIMLPHLQNTPRNLSQQQDNSANQQSPEALLQTALNTGEQQGIHLAHLLAMQVAINQQNNQQVKQLIRQYANAAPVQQPENGMLFETMAQLQIQAISDQIWTEEIGYRTPPGQLGKFSSDPVAKKETIEIDDLL